MYVALARRRQNYQMQTFLYLITNQSIGTSHFSVWGGMRGFPLEVTRTFSFH